MKKFDQFENMGPIERREFLLALTALFGVPSLFSRTRQHDILSLLLKDEAALAQATATPSYFLEVNFRDQWDFGNLFIAPSIAQNYESIKSQIAVYDTPIAERRNFYVTTHGTELRPHLDTIAVIELGDCTLDGSQSVHGHEAGNPLRSPGRSQTGGAGRIDMATLDKRPGTSGNEVLYSSTPTPLVLHNSVQKQLQPSLTNGALLRSSVRTGTHTFYHFEANLANAQVDRYFDKTTFLNNINKNTTDAVSPLAQVITKHGSAIADLMKKVDADYLRRIASDNAQSTKHQSNMDAFKQKIVQSAQTVSQKISLSAQEISNWTQGIGPQLECPGDDSLQCFTRGDKTNIGELFGYAFKMFQSQRIRSVGIDFDVSDVHNDRTPFLLRNQAQQTALPLARLIQNLKDAGLYENTIIAMYTLDGGRSPMKTSTGDGTKNSVIIAGGKIKGGYYGDIKVSTNGNVQYFRPDDNGNAVLTGTTGRSQRVAAADIYKTVLSGTNVPTSVLDSFPDVKNGKVLKYILPG